MAALFHRDTRRPLRSRSISSRWTPLRRGSDLRLRRYSARPSPACWSGEDLDRGHECSITANLTVTQVTGACITVSSGAMGRGCRSMDPVGRLLPRGRRPRRSSLIMSLHPSGVSDERDVARGRCIAGGSVVNRSPRRPRRAEMHAASTANLRDTGPSPEMATAWFTLPYAFQTLEKTPFRSESSRHQLTAATPPRGGAGRPRRIARERASPWEAASNRVSRS